MGKLCIIRHCSPDIEAQLAALEYLLRLPKQGEDTLVSGGPVDANRQAAGPREPHATDLTIPAPLGDALREGNEAE